MAEAPPTSLVEADYEDLTLQDPEKELSAVPSGYGLLLLLAATASC